jgi:hypothetical protein
MSTSDDSGTPHAAPGAQGFGQGEGPGVDAGAVARDEQGAPDASREATPAGRPAPGLAVTLALYTLARIALVAVIAALLTVAGVPLLLAVLLGLIVALPLSLVVFRSLRARLDLALAEAGRRRSAERESLRSRLRGEEPRPADPGGSEAGGEDGQPSEHRAEREADAGRG